MFSARSFAHSIAEAPAAKTAERLPEWNLADLYAGIDDPAVKRDLDRADADCGAFEADYRRRVLAAYPPRADGTTLFPFTRLFIVAVK